MRLGGPVLTPYSGPQEWVNALQDLGYRAALCPVNEAAPDATVREYAQAAMEADILIAEVGAWSNPISADDAERARALEHCKRRLDLAERIGARCCVNIAGSRGARWDGPHPDNLSEATFERVVASVQEIIDSVQPEKTCYALESMPWVWPDSPDSYLALLKAIDRPQFAVHLDPVNMINCPARYYRTREFLLECFAKLGPHIRSCHAKDILLDDSLTVHLREACPGAGRLDYAAFLSELNRLDPDTPLLLEHLESSDAYLAAATYVRKVAAELLIAL